MAIATLDAALAGMQPGRYITKAVTPTMVAGRPQSLWGLGGSPGAGSFDTTLAGVALSSTSAQVAGQIPHTDPVTGNSYLARFTGAATQPGTLLLCDRLWHNGGISITTTTAQTVNSATFPARDIAGTTNGDGVLVGIEVSSAAGAAAPAPTFSYTNQSGTSGRSAGLAFATANSPTAGAFFPFGLQAGDTGVRSIQSLTLGTSWASGTINLVAYRVLGALPLSQANVANELDALTSGMPRLFNGVVPFLIFVPNTTTASNVSGVYTETQG